MHLIEIRPAAHDVVVVNLPAGTTLRVHHPAGPRDYTASLAGERLIAAIPGDRAHLGWGAGIIRYPNARAVRNGHHRLDRPVWHEAHKQVRRGGISIIRHDQRDHFGNARWTASAVHPA